MATDAVNYTAPDEDGPEAENSPKTNCEYARCKRKQGQAVKELEGHQMQCSTSSHVQCRRIRGPQSLASIGACFTGRSYWRSRKQA